MSTSDDEVRARIDAVANDANFMKPIDKKLYDKVKQKVNNSVATDIVEVTEDELYNFADYWKGMSGNQKALDAHNIPGDIILEGTVPITDMIIRVSSKDVKSHHGLTDIRIILFEDTLSKLKLLSKDFDRYEDLVITVGGILISEELQLVFPLMLINNNNSIQLGMWSAVASMKLSHSQYTKLYKSVDSQLKSIMMTVLGMVCPAWYGMQLALLHPATKNIFANPIREKRSRKEQLNPVMVNGIPKKVKYVRRHVINTDNNIYRTLDNAMNEMCRIDGDLNKNAYTRRTYLWRVIGHPRTLSSGKQTWVKPHWRGPLKDFAKIVRAQVNEREIDIVEED